MGANTGLIITLLLVSIAAVGLSGFLFSAAGNYGATVPDQYQNAFNKFNETQALTNNLQSTTDNGSINPAATTDLGIDKSVLIAGKQAQASASLFNSLLYDMAQIFGVSPAIVVIFVTIIIIISLAAIIALFVKVIP